MNIKEEAHEVINGLSESDVLLLLAFYNEHIKNREHQASINKKRAAYEDMVRMKLEHPFPKDFDMEKELEESG